MKRVKDFITKLLLVLFLVIFVLSGLACALVLLATLIPVVALIALGRLTGTSVELERYITIDSEAI